MRAIERILINRNFSLFWTGQSVSLLGDAVLEVILPVWMATLSGSPSLVALVAGLQVLPAIFVGPFAGVFADRWDPRRTMVLCDLLRAVTLCVLLVLPFQYLPHGIYVVSFVAALFSLFFIPSRAILVRGIVPDHAITQSWALLRTTESLALVVGPALGAGLLAIGPRWGVLFDVVTYAVGAATLCMIAIGRSERPVPLKGRSDGALFVELLDGIRHVRHGAKLMVIFGASAIVNVVGFIWFTVDAFFVEQSLGLPKEAVGLLWACSGVGGFVGGVMQAKFAFHPHRVLSIGILVKGISLIFYANSNQIYAAALAAGVSGLSGVIVTIAAMTIIVNDTPHSVLGRVTALYETTSHLTTLVGIAFIVAIGAYVKAADILFVGGIFMVCTGILTHFALQRRGGAD
ncbi:MULTISPECIES: MFS transporter [unclassified Inquilinus]|uniref:MFS transporter n=1 Tax=unclassified Inquilinus TaxID=2645927 RepID=UPI003F8EB86A